MSSKEYKQDPLGNHLFQFYYDIPSLNNSRRSANQILNTIPFDLGYLSFANKSVTYQYLSRSVNYLNRFLYWVKLHHKILGE